MTTITLSSKGQITLPSEIRQHLGLHVGDRFVAEEVEGTIVLKPLHHRSFLEACESSAGIYKGRALSVDEMKGAWGEAAAERYSKKKRA